MIDRVVTIKFRQTPIGVRQDRIPAGVGCHDPVGAFTDPGDQRRQHRHVAYGVSDAVGHHAMIAQPPPDHGGFVAMPTSWPHRSSEDSIRLDELRRSDPDTAYPRFGVCTTRSVVCLLADDPVVVSVPVPVVLRVLTLQVRAEARGLRFLARIEPWVRARIHEGFDLGDRGRRDDRLDDRW